MNRFHKLGLIVLAASAIAGVSVQTIGAAPGTATIEVRKMLVPSNDPGLWNLLVRYTGGPIITEVFNVSNNGHTPRVTIPAATWLTVEELQGTNTLMSNYSPVLNCFVFSGPDKGFAFPPVNYHGAKFQFTAGDNYTCTFTNTRKAGTAPGKRPRLRRA